MHSTEGIILKKTDLGEDGALFTIYTKDFVKIRALAQGVKKEGAKLKGHLEPLSLSSVSFVLGKNGERLTHAALNNFWPGIREDYQKLAAAQKIAILVDQECLPGEKDEPLWELLAESLLVLDDQTFSSESLVNLIGSFEKNFAACLGYADRPR